MFSINPSQKTVVYAYEKGYRVTEAGVYVNPKGLPLLITIRSNHKYPQAQIRIEGKNHNYLIHRLAAYCFYGDQVFVEGIHVRHLNGNVLDVSRTNIALGSRSENERDKPKEVRRTNAKSANARRRDTRRLTMRKFTDDEVRNIKRRLSEGERGVDIAREYDVVKDTIYQIKRGETYADILL